jgi:hypothetical protein
MNDFVRFQLMQRRLVEAGLESTLDARREGNQAVFSLTVHVHEQNSDGMARLAALTTENGFSFTFEKDDRAALTLLAA